MVTVRARQPGSLTKLRWHSRHISVGIREGSAPVAPGLRTLGQAGVLQMPVSTGEQPRASSPSRKAGRHDLFAATQPGDIDNESNRRFGEGAGADSRIGAVRRATVVIIARTSPAPARSMTALTPHDEPSDNVGRLLSHRSRLNRHTGAYERRRRISVLEPAWCQRGCG